MITIPAFVVHQAFLPLQVRQTQLGIVEVGEVAERPFYLSERKVAVLAGMADVFHLGFLLTHKPDQFVEQAVQHALVGLMPLSLLQSGTAHVGLLDEPVVDPVRHSV